MSMSKPLSQPQTINYGKVNQGVWLRDEHVAFNTSTLSIFVVLILPLRRNQTWKYMIACAIISSQYSWKLCHKAMTQKFTTEYNFMIGSRKTKKKKSKSYMILVWKVFLQAKHVTWQWNVWDKMDRRATLNYCQVIGPFIGRYHVSPEACCSKILVQNNHCNDLTRWQYEVRANVFLRFFEATAIRFVRLVSRQHISGDLRKAEMNIRDNSISWIRRTYECCSPVTFAQIMYPLTGWRDYVLL